MSLYSSANGVEDRGRQRTCASLKHCLYPLVCGQLKVEEKDQSIDQTLVGMKGHIYLINYIEEK